MGVDETVMYACEILIRDKLAQGDEAAALEMTRRLVAPALGATLAASDVHPTLFFAPLREACKREGFPLEVIDILDEPRDEYYKPIAARLFAKVDPDAFMRSMGNLLHAEEAAVLPPEHSAFVSAIRNFVAYLASPSGAPSLAWPSKVHASPFFNRLRDACMSGGIALDEIDTFAEPGRTRSFEHIAWALFAGEGYRECVRAMTELLEYAWDAGLKPQDSSVVRGIRAILDYLQSPACELLFDIHICLADLQVASRTPDQL